MLGIEILWRWSSSLSFFHFQYSNIRCLFFIRFSTAHLIDVDIRSLRGMDIEKVVGSGTFGVVFKATVKETGERVALKKFKLEIDPQSQGFPMQVRAACTDIMSAKEHIHPSTALGHINRDHTALVIWHRIILTILLFTAYYWFVRPDFHPEVTADFSHQPISNIEPLSLPKALREIRILKAVKLQNHVNIVKLFTMVILLDSLTTFYMTDKLRSQQHVI